MNIFVTDPCPKRSAWILDDRRVNKMIIESLQMMAYAIARYSEDPNHLPKTKLGKPYKVNGPHKKHPCSVWAGNTRENFLWLLMHTIELIREKEKRYPKGATTKFYRLAVIQCFKSRRLIFKKHLQGFQNSSLHKDISDACLAYRLTMVHKWETAKEKSNIEKRISLLPRWSNTRPPGWYEHFVSQQFNYKVSN